MSARKNKEESRSKRLKKYAQVYDEVIKGNKERVEKKGNDSVPLSSSKELNPYQKFYKDESKKKKYENLSSKERMAAIAKVWGKIKLGAV